MMLPAEPTPATTPRYFVRTWPADDGIVYFRSLTPYGSVVGVQANGSVAVTSLRSLKRRHAIKLVGRGKWKEITTEQAAGLLAGELA